MAEDTQARIATGARAICALCDGDPHVSVTTATGVLARLIAALVKASTTPDASVDPTLAATDAALREYLRSAGVTVTAPPRTVKELAQDAGLGQPTH